MVDFPHKVLVPQRPGHLVSRPRLHALLNSITDRRLITLSAPAGYGKTSLLTDFATAAPLPVCWYTLDPLDQDPWIFLDYMVASVEHRFPGAMVQTAQMLEGYSRTGFSTVLGTFIRELYSVGRDFVILLDDWHLVDHVSEICDVITNLLLRCPHCHLILSSRTYPGLPNIMLLTARRQMSSLDEHQLRFTPDEISAVIQAEYEVQIAPEEAATLAEQSNGWITGILLSFQAASCSALSSALSGMSAERQIYRFLAEQVFDQQPAEIRQFLLDSVLLEELTAEHCDTLFQRSDSRRLLEALLRRRLFISEVRPGVLRYPTMFREFLAEHFSTIDPDRYQRLALQVADAYAAQGQWIQAFDRYILAGQRAAALRVIATGGEQLYNSGRLETLEHWFGLVPADDLDSHLLCLKARVLLDRGRYHEAQLVAQLAEQSTQPERDPRVMLLQAQLSRIAGRYEQSLEVAQQVLTLTEEMGLRASALRMIAICHHRLGQTIRAIDELNQALTIERQRGDMHAIAHLQRDLGICHQDIGRLHAAEEYYTHADGYWATIGNTGLRAMSLNSKGGVQRLAGRYVEAYSTLVLALRYARESALPHYQAVVLSSLGDLYSDLQSWSRAGVAYSDARATGGSAYLMSCLDISEVTLLLRQRQYEDAARMLRQLPDATLRRHSSAVLLLRGNIACGLGNYQQGALHAQELTALLDQTGAATELALAHLLHARVAAGQHPDDAVALIEPLERLTALAAQVGHDSFVVAETLHLRSLLRRAVAAGWLHAEQWLERHQDIRLAAQVLEADDQRPLLVVRTLGIDTIVLNGQPVELGWQKAREVLYYLLAHPDGASIDSVREAIWPNLALERSRDTLRTAIYHLRSVLPRDLIALRGRQSYQVNRDIVRIDYDVERFLDGLETCGEDLDALLEALDLYRGPYLAHVENQWCVGPRTQFEQRYLQAHHQAAIGYERQNLYADAMLLYQRILLVDQLDEAAHAGVMRCQIRLGNRAAAIHQYQLLRRTLSDELGLDPGETSEVEHLYHQILAES